MEIQRCINQKSKKQKSEMLESGDGNPEMQKIEIQRSRHQKCGKVEMEIQRCRNSKCAQAGKAAGKIEDLGFTDQRAALMI